MNSSDRFINKLHYQVVMNNEKFNAINIAAIIPATIISVSPIADILFDNYSALAQQVKNKEQEEDIRKDGNEDDISEKQHPGNNNQQQETDCQSGQYFHPEYQVCLPESEKELSDREKFREQIDVEPGNLDQFNCREGDVLAGVHNPGRLKVLSICEEVIGVVGEDKGVQGDGDHVYLLDVGDQYKHMLNEDNYKKQDGMLVVEIIPADQDSSLLIFQKKATEFMLLVPG